MAPLGVGLADTEPKSQFSIELGMSEVDVAAPIQPVHQELIGLISRAEPEANEIELGRRGQFEAGIIAHPCGK